MGTCTAREKGNNARNGCTSKKQTTIARKESKRVIVLKGRSARKALRALTLCVLFPAGHDRFSRPPEHGKKTYVAINFQADCSAAVQQSGVCPHHATLPQY